MTLPAGGASSCSTCGGSLASGAGCARCETRELVPDDPDLEQTRDLGTSPTQLPTVGLDSHTPNKKSPQRIAHFAIRRELGVGGMGTVYLARDEKMDRDVALKVLSSAHSSEKAGARFEQEAWIAGRLDHPNIVTVYECGSHDGLRYFSMEVVDGGSLEDVIQNLRRSGRDDGWELEFGSSRYIHWALQTVIASARGLAFAHGRGIVHRDVKPLNLLMSRSHGCVKIADFGLALDVEATRMTTVGTIMGTVTFMAPEQLRGESDRIDARTDVYALGVTLFELLTLELPYSGRTQQLYMSQVLTSEARRARKLNARVGRDLETVIRKAIEKEPRDRYQTAAAFADDIENVLHLRPIQAKPEGISRRVTKWVRRKPIHAALAATLVVAVPAMGIVAGRTLRDRSAARGARITRLLDEAQWLGLRKQPRAMLQNAETVLGLDPRNVLAIRHRAMARFLIGSSEGNEEERKRLLAEALNDVSSLAAALPTAAWPHAIKARMLTAMGRAEDAKAEGAEASRLQGTVPSDEDLGEEARLAVVEWDLKKALGLFSELIRRHPDSVGSISSRGLVQEGLRDLTSAGVDYRVAVGLDPTYDLGFIDLARVSIEQDRLDEAESFLERARSINPENPVAGESQGNILMRRGWKAKSAGETEKARALFQQSEDVTRAALQRSDKLIWAELNLAAAIGERGKLQEPPDSALLSEAIDGYERVLGRYGTTPAGGQEKDVYIAALQNTCDAQISLRRLQEALRDCSRLAELLPDNATAFYNLAGVQALRGEGQEALAALRRDLALGDVDWEYLASDAWFESLRGHREFGEIVTEMKRRASQAATPNPTQ